MSDRRDPLQEEPSHDAVQAVRDVLRALKTDGKETGEWQRMEVRYDPRADDWLVIHLGEQSSRRVSEG